MFLLLYLGIALVLRMALFRMQSYATETYWFDFIVVHAMKWSEVAQSCPTLCNPIACSLPGSSVHGIFQAIVLEWIAISFSRGSSPPRDWNRVSHIVCRRFTVWATRGVRIFTSIIKFWKKVQKLFYEMEGQAPLMLWTDLHLAKETQSL